MILDLLFKLISEAQERQQRAQQERARAAGIPMAVVAEGEPKKRKKKKKRHHQEQVAAEAPPARRRETPTVEEILPTLPTVHETAIAGRDVRRMFVLGEILGPPVALREDGPL